MLFSYERMSRFFILSFIIIPSRLSANSVVGAEVADRDTHLLVESGAVGQARREVSHR